MSKPKRLYRDNKEKLLGGVCAGLAHYFNVDPTIMRLLYIMLVIITGGVAVFAYLVMWVITPQKTTCCDSGGRIIDHE